MLTDQPLKDILQRVDLSGRLVKWSIELSEYDIEFKGRKAIKAQVLADFIAECTFRHQRQPAGDNEKDADSPPLPLTLSDKHWVLHTDGSCAKDGSGAGILL